MSPLRLKFELFFTPKVLSFGVLGGGISPGASRMPEEFLLDAYKIN